MKHAKCMNIVDIGYRLQSDLCPYRPTKEPTMWW